MISNYVVEKYLKVRNNVSCILVVSPIDEAGVGCKISKRRVHETTSTSVVNSESVEIVPTCSNVIQFYPLVI